MNKPTYTKLDSMLNPLPVDSTEKHLAVRVEHPLLAKPIIVAAYRASKRDLTFKGAQKAAAEHDAYGLTWRAPTVEEAFFIADRTRSDETLDKNFFPDAEGWEWTWTSDLDASSPSDCAWGVYLGTGFCYRLNLGSRGYVRAVLAGQS
jgi:hypothetical protein